MDQETIDNLCTRAIHWWMGRRPVGWSDKEHLDNPTINCPTDRERSLALAVAGYVSSNGE
jgi:hypothetical protein